MDFIADQFPKAVSVFQFHVSIFNTFPGCVCLSLEGWVCNNNPGFESYGKVVSQALGRIREWHAASSAFGCL